MTALLAVTAVAPVAGTAAAATTFADAMAPADPRQSTFVSAPAATFVPAARPPVGPANPAWRPEAGPASAEPAVPATAFPPQADAAPYAPVPAPRPRRAIEALVTLTAVGLVPMAGSVGEPRAPSREEARSKGRPAGEATASTRNWLDRIDDAPRLAAASALVAGGGLDSSLSAEATPVPLPPALVGGAITLAVLVVARLRRRMA